MQPQIRVVQLVTGLSIGEEMGGAELFGVELARHLDRAEFEVLVCGLWRYDSKSERRWVGDLEREGFEVVLLGDPKKPMITEFPKAIGAFWRLLDRFEPHLINSHAERTDVLNVMAHLLHRAHPVSVRTMNTEWQWQKSPWLGWLLNLALFPWAFDEEVPISAAARDVLTRRPLFKLLGRHSPDIIYNGIDESLLQEVHVPYPDVLSSYGIPGELPRIGNIGRLTLQKGHIHFIRAARLVVDQTPASFIIVGAGPLEPDLKAEVEALGITDSVHFLGGRDGIRDVLTNLDLLVSSSLWEGLPTVILEAMALGVPIVATDVSGSREVIRTGETGRLVQPESPDQLAGAILKAIKDTEPTRLLAEQARRYVRNFTIQHAASNYADLYRRLTCDVDLAVDKRHGTEHHG